MTCFFISPALEYFPLFFNIFEVFEDYFADNPFFGACDIERKRFFDVERLCVEPEFAFHPPFSAMNVNGLVSFVGVKEKSPAKKQEDCRHAHPFSYRFVAT
jgi:hypothetical protein